MTTSDRAGTRSGTGGEPAAHHPRLTGALRTSGLDDVNDRGHLTRTRVPDGRGLPEHEEIRAAAGNPRAVFPVAPRDLIVHAGGTVVDVRERTA